MRNVTPDEYRLLGEFAYRLILSIKYHGYLAKQQNNDSNMKAISLQTDTVPRDAKLTSSSCRRKLGAAHAHTHSRDGKQYGNAEEHPK